MTKEAYNEKYEFYAEKVYLEPEDTVVPEVTAALFPALLALVPLTEQTRLLSMLPVAERFSSAISVTDEAAQKLNILGREYDMSLRDLKWKLLCALLASPNNSLSAEQVNQVAGEDLSQQTVINLVAEFNRYFRKFIKNQIPDLPAYLSFTSIPYHGGISVSLNLWPIK